MRCIFAVLWSVRGVLVLWNCWFMGLRGYSSKTGSIWVKGRDVSTVQSLGIGFSLIPLSMSDLFRPHRLGLGLRLPTFTGVQGLGI